jgi:hypothetical protein
MKNVGQRRLAKSTAAIAGAGIASGPSRTYRRS